MSSGGHSTLVISHPDEILRIAKSSGRLRDQINYLIRTTKDNIVSHPDDILHLS